MTTTEIEARQLEDGDQLVRTTKAGTVLRITLSYVGETILESGIKAIIWEGLSANYTPRTGLLGYSEKVQVTSR